MNVRQFLSAKKKILIPLVILILMAGGFFYWWKGDEVTRMIERKRMIRVSPYSPPEEYVIRDIPEGKLIENKKQGFKAIVWPEWRVEIVEDPYWITGVVTILSPDVQFNPQIYSPFDPLMHLLAKGCEINTKIMKNSEDTIYDADHIREKINEIKQSQVGFVEVESGGIIFQGEEMGKGTFYRHESTEIDSQEALKEIVNYNEKVRDKLGITQKVTIQIPIKNKVYFIETILLQENQEKCREKFDEFLKTVSIE